MIKPKWIFLSGITFVWIAAILLLPRVGVKPGDTVTMDYTLLLDDGGVYYSSAEAEPFKVTLGQGKLLPGFEQQVIGMHVGASRKFTLAPEQAYGQYRPELVGTLERSRLAENLEPEIGKQVQTEFRDGTPALAVITAFTDTTVTLDANHPLAGHTLTYEIQVVAIENISKPTTSNQAARNWLELAGGAAVAGSIFLSLSNRRFSTATKRIVAKRSQRRRITHSRA